MKLASILSPELILCDLSGSNRPNIYRTMLERAVEQCDIPIDTETTLDAMLEREAATHLPYEGVGLPHLLLPELQDLYVIIGILREPVMLKDYDAAPARLIVMSLIAETTTSTYLRSTSAFVRYLTLPGKLDALSGCHTPEAVLEQLTVDDVKLKKTLTAEDLACGDWPTVYPDDNLSMALDVCTRSACSMLAVVDRDRQLLGVLDTTEVIKSFIPDYIFMMDNLNFLSSLEVFERIFNEENRHKVRDYMSKAVQIPPDTPLIQFTVRLARRETTAIFVTDSSGKLIGGINMKDVVRRVLRG